MTQWSQNQVRIEGTLENKRWLTTWVDLKTGFELYSFLKNHPIRLQNSKTTPKLIQNQKSELKERKKILQFLNHPEPKNSPHNHALFYFYYWFCIKNSLYVLLQLTTMHRNEKPFVGRSISTSLWGKVILTENVPSLIFDKKCSFWEG